MSLRLSPISFKSNLLYSQGGASTQAAANEIPQGISDYVSEMDNQKPPKVRKTFSERFAGVWKFFASADQLVKSYVKGILYGLASGAFMASLFWMFGALPSAFKKSGPTLKSVLQHPLKSISTKGKILTGLVTLGVAAGNIISGHWQKNQRTAVIDHKMNVGHRDQ